MLPLINSHQLGKLDTPSKILMATSDLENSNMKNYELNTSMNKIENIEEQQSESSDDSEISQKIEPNNNINNSYKSKGIKANNMNNSSIKHKNINNSMDDSTINKNNISIHSNHNGYSAKFSSSLINKHKKAAQANLFMTNISSKVETLPLLKDKTSELEKNLNNSIEAINYNYGDTGLKSFKDKEKTSTNPTIGNFRKSKPALNLEKTNHEKIPNIITNRTNHKLNSINNSINEENENILSVVNTKSTQKVETYGNACTNDNTEQSSKTKVIDNFGSTKVFLLQSSKLKSNKLKRMYQENIPRYFNNRLNTSSADEPNNCNIEINEETPIQVNKKDFSNEKINPYVSKSPKFIPFSVDNSVNAIKKFHKKIQMQAPKKKYNFIINKY